MPKKRVHEIAKEQGLSSKELLDKLHAAGVEAKVASSSVEESEALARARVNGDGAAHGRRVPRADSGGCTARGGRARARRNAGARAVTTGRPHPGGSARPRASDPSHRRRRLRGPRPHAPPRGGRPAAPPAGVAATHAGRGPCTADRPRRRGRSRRTPRPAALHRRAVRPTRDSRTGERAPGGVGPGGRRRVVIDSQASRRQQGGPAQPPPAPHAPRAPAPRAPTRRPSRRCRAREVARRRARVAINSGSTVKDVAEYLDVPVPEIIKRLMALGEMATLTQTLSDEAIMLLAEELGKQVEIVHAADDARGRARLRGRRGGPARARAGRDDHGPRRPRQDLAARRDPRDRGRLLGGRRHHAAHRRLPGATTPASGSPSSTRPATRRSRRCARAARASPTSR